MRHRGANESMGGAGPRPRVGICGRRPGPAPPGPPGLCRTQPRATPASWPSAPNCAPSWTARPPEILGPQARRPAAGGARGLRPAQPHGRGQRAGPALDRTRERAGAPGSGEFARQEPRHRAAGPRAGRGHGGAGSPRRPAQRRGPQAERARRWDDAGRGSAAHPPGVAAAGGDGRTGPVRQPRWLEALDVRARGAEAAEATTHRWACRGPHHRERGRERAAAHHGAAGGTPTPPPTQPPGLAPAPTTAARRQPHAPCGQPPSPTRPRRPPRPAAAATGDRQQERDAPAAPSGRSELAPGGLARSGPAGRTFAGWMAACPARQMIPKRSNKPPRRWSIGRARWKPRPKLCAPRPRASSQQLPQR